MLVWASVWTVRHAYIRHICLYNCVWRVLFILLSEPLFEPWDLPTDDRFTCLIVLLWRKLSILLIICMTMLVWASVWTMRLAHRRHIYLSSSVWRVLAILLIIRRTMLVWASVWTNQTCLHMTHLLAYLCCCEKIYLACWLFVWQC